MDPSPRSHVGALPTMLHPTTYRPDCGVAVTPGFRLVRASVWLYEVRLLGTTDQLPPPSADRSQTDFLRAHGIEDLAHEAEQAWQERAHIGDLQALVARGRAQEAGALTDTTGLGGFRVLEWACGVDLDG